MKGFPKRTAGPSSSVAIVFVCVMAGIGSGHPSTETLGSELSVNDCGVSVVLDKVTPVSRNNRPLTYTATNLGKNNIRTIVLVGIPGATKSSIFFPEFLRPGDQHVYTGGNARWKGVDNVSAAVADLSCMLTVRPAV